YSLRLLEETFAEDHPFGLPACPKRFGCQKCHRVKFFSMTGAGAWNEVICQLSGGLLYGSEVEKPGWWAKEVAQGRRRAFAPKLMREPSKRRAEVMELLMKAMKRREMARVLGVGRSRVDTLIDRIYKEHRVHGVLELKEVVEGKRGEIGRAESKRLAKAPSS